ncbi:MAG TPA: polyhydroxyalkanoate synthesis repressor PhaR [Gammaproteobacteria bacterium]|nr:polyhydroxyalkanoate synthesis repressor PhaR [Gammaproteobacteria bacterium]
MVTVMQEPNSEKPAMGDKRLIKKYPNRRLYDTTESHYITLEDVRRLVVQGIEFCVTDQKTGEDITRSILLQIILEQEDDGEPIFTTDVLLRIIRCYGDTVQGLAGEFLERSLFLFTEQQKLFQARLDEAIKNNPFTAITDLTQRNLAIWKAMQNSFFKAAGITGMAKDDTASTKEKGK